MKERTIKNLLSDDYALYLYFANEEVKALFVKNADSEGFCFGDGVSLYERELDEMMAVKSNGTVNFLGFAGSMAFRHPEMALYDIVRIDYARYLAGDKEYFYSDKQE